jgi:acyl carrier protein
MDDTEERLSGCFTAVFAELSPLAARTARIESVKGWDSIAAATLVSLVEEEFRIRIAPADLPELTSFDAFHRYVEARSQAA